MIADPIRVLLVDDEPMFMEAVRALLETDQRVEVVASAETGLEALDLAGSEHPDVVLVDLAMPGMDGYALTKALRESAPALRVIVLSGLTQAEVAQAAIAAGAHRFLLKGELHDEIAQAIVDAVSDGPLH